jgi:hypothetical protein
MSQLRRSVAVVATLAAVAAVPATASASTGKSASKTSVAAVQKNVNNARSAVKQLKRAVRAGKSTTAKRALKTARSQSAAASRTSRSMATVAVGPDASATAAQALTLAGTQYDTLLKTLTALVDDGPAQSLIAGSIQPTIAGKTQILQALIAVLPNVPASVQPTLASIIAALGAGDATPVVNLDNALNVGTLPTSITGLVSQCLAMATQAIQTALSLIQGILPMMPTEAQAPMGSILSSVAGITGTLIPSVLSTITGLIDTIIGSLPIVGGGTGAGAPAVGSLGGLFGGLLGGIVGSGTGTVPGAGNIGNMITDLLGGLLGGDGSGGTSANPIGGIMATVTGLINSLLGGIIPAGVVPAVPAT